MTNNAPNEQPPRYVELTRGRSKLRADLIEGLLRQGAIRYRRLGTRHGEMVEAAQALFVQRFEVHPEDAPMARKLVEDYDARATAEADPDDDLQEFEPRGRRIMLAALYLGIFLLALMVGFALLPQRQQEATASGTVGERQSSTPQGRSMRGEPVDEFKRLFEKTAAGGGKERAAEAEKQRARRRQLQNEYGRLYEEVAAILFESDPIGINFGDNPDEYYPEVDTILPRLRSCSSPEEVQTVVYEEFLKSLCAEIGSPRIHAASR